MASRADTPKPFAWIKLVTGVAALMAAAPGFAADPYPSKPISMIVPFAAGGPTDVVARTSARPCPAPRPDRGDREQDRRRRHRGARLRGQAAPDGYTILIHHNGMATAPALYRKLSYNPLTDFEYIGQVVDVPMTLLGRKDLPPNTAAELIEPTSQANEDKVNLAHAGLGAVSHLCGMLFQQAVGRRAATVPFQGTAPALNALLGGQVDLLCDQTTQTIPHIKAGTVKMYGVTTPEPHQRPARCADAGRAGTEGLRHGRSGTASTRRRERRPRSPSSTAALRAALKDPAVAKRMAELGAEIVPDVQADAGRPADLAEGRDRQVAADAEKRGRHGGLIAPVPRSAREP